jgi:hypothetical protein
VPRYALICRALGVEHHTSAGRFLANFIVAAFLRVFSDVRNRTTRSSIRGLSTNGHEVSNRAASVDAKGRWDLDRAVGTFEQGALPHTSPGKSLAGGPSLSPPLGWGFPLSGVPVSLSQQLRQPRRSEWMVVPPGKDVHHCFSRAGRKPLRAGLSARALQLRDARGWPLTAASSEMPRDGDSAAKPAAEDD